MAKSRRALIEARKLQQAASTETPSEDKIFQDLIPQIRAGKLVPIIGGTVRTEHIFDVDFDQEIGVADTQNQRAMAARPSNDSLNDEASETISDLSIGEFLADWWADEVGYPMPDRYRIARIAQYHSLKVGIFQAKSDYLDFQKRCLIKIAGLSADEIADEEERQEFTDTVTKLSSQIHRPFAELVRELDFPRFPPGKEDPLRILARLPNSIFVTTSYHDFVERALKLEGKTPKTRLCFWNITPDNVEAQHRVTENDAPSPLEPVVYHLFGLDQYPNSLVLSEDDCLDFLMRLARGPASDSGEDWVVPPYIEAELTESSLLLLGYRLEDWDFRVLFHGLMAKDLGKVQQRRPSVAIQVDPEDQPNIENAQEVREYLSRYFQHANVRVHWGSSDDFVDQLWKRWQVETSAEVAGSLT